MQKAGQGGIHLQILFRIHMVKVRVETKSWRSTTIYRGRFASRVRTNSCRQLSGAHLEIKPRLETNRLGFSRCGRKLMRGAVPQT